MTNEEELGLQVATSLAGSTTCNCRDETSDCEVARHKRAARFVHAPNTDSDGHGPCPSELLSERANTRRDASRRQREPDLDRLARWLCLSRSRLSLWRVARRWTRRWRAAGPNWTQGERSLCL